MFLACCLSLLAVPAPAVTKPALWQVTITQVDQNDKALTDAVRVACPPSGCEQMLQLYVDFKLRPFLAAITFVDTGAYLALQPMVRDLGQAIDFQQGYRGPVFVSVRSDENDKIGILRFTLTGLNVPQVGQGNVPVLTDPQSLVFHRKLEPDLILRIELVRPAAAS